MTKPIEGRRLRLRAHAITPLHAMLGVGVAASAYAVPPPFVVTPDTFEVLAVRPTSGTLLLGNVLDNDSGDRLTALGSFPESISVGSFDITGNGVATVQVNAADVCYAENTTIGYVVRDFGDINRSQAIAQVNFVAAGAPDAYEGTTGNPISGVLRDNDAYLGDPRYTPPTSYRIARPPRHGTLSSFDTSTSAFTYTPNAGFSSTDDFAYHIVGPDYCNAAYTVGLVVGPALTDDAYTTPFQTTVAANVLDNDQGNALSVVGFSAPSHGSANVVANGSFQYVPAAGFSGIDTFRYDVTDRNGVNASANVVITVGDGVPQPGDDFAIVLSGQSVSANALVNDSDPNGDPLSVANHSAPSHGLATIAANGDFTYTANSGYSGDDSFSYVVEDGRGANATATVYLTVQPVGVDDQYSTAYATTLAANVLANDLGSALSIVGHDSPAHGTLALAADGSFTYVPAAGFSGGDSFHYSAHDDVNQNVSATVSISVGNGAPVAVADSVSTVAGQSASGNVLANDSDPDGGTLSVAGNSAPSQGTASVAADGSFIYTPAAGFSGHDAFAYTVVDGQGGNAVADVSVLVTPLAVPDAFVGGFAGTLSGNVLANDEGSGLTAAVAVPAQHGSLVLNADGSFTYTPDADFSGADGFDYVVTDSAGSSASAHVSFSVQAAPTPVPTLDRRLLALLAAALAWLGLRQRRRDA